MVRHREFRILESAEGVVVEINQGLKRELRIPVAGRNRRLKERGTFKSGNLRLLVGACQRKDLIANVRSDGDGDNELLCRREGDRINRDAD